ncbi:hypothetical protein PPACK8108_LOCUS2508, partial [Phakopsora pachyrhizi]
HIKASSAWKTATTHAARKKLLTKEGTWWSVLNELEDWDPTKLVVVDTMHCLSGILEYHACRVWNLDLLSKELQKNQQAPTILLKDALSSGIGNMIADEEDFYESPQSNLRFQSGNLVPHHKLNTPAIDHSEILEIKSALNILLIDQDIYNDDGDILKPEVESFSYPSLLNTEHLKIIHQTIKRCSVPPWMHLPPANLGNAAHGKLQSADWIILFTTIIPFAIPLLENLDETVIKIFFDLVIISEIILNYKPSEQAVENYYKHLVSY